MSQDRFFEIRHLIIWISYNVKGLNIAFILCTQISIIKYKSSLINAAACIAILFLMKTGIFSSMKGLQSGGEKAIGQYYASQIGQELAEEIFPSELNTKRLNI